MAYIAKRKATAEGLYGFLERAERVFYEGWLLAQQRRTNNGYAGEWYPRQRRLEAFATLSPVNVASGEIFGWGAVEAGAPQVQRPPGRLPERVVVSADDVVAFTDAEWERLFVEESGL